jgi:hypothetical protein
MTTGDDLKRKLAESGWHRGEAWFGPELNVQPADKAKNNRISDAERKRAQRERDKADGWLQCTVKAPDDEEARALIALVATAIRKPSKRRAIRAVIDDPSLITLGRRYRRMLEANAKEVKRASAKTGTGAE